MQGVVEGRVEDVRSVDNGYFTTLMGKAVDEYAMPPVFEIRSNRRLGKPGDIVTVSCSVQGYRERPFVTKDGETVRRIRMTLVADDA